MSERTRPHDLDAERYVLAGVIVDNARFADVAAVIGVEDFYRAAHQQLWRAVCALIEQQSAVDLVTLKNRCASDGVLDAVGGAVYISTLVDGMPRSANVEHYAKIIHEKAMLRGLMAEADRIFREAEQGRETAAEIIASAERAVMNLSRQAVRLGLMPMDAVMSSVLDSIEEAQKRKGAVLGVPTGLSEVDAILHGLMPGKLITLAARPGVGKSAFALNAATAAATAGKRVAVFSLEMDAVEIGRRQVAALARVDGHKLQGGWASEVEWQRIGRVLGELSTLPMKINEASTLNIFEIRAQCLREQAEHGLDLVVLDYLQLVEPTERLHNRNLEISEMTRGLKQLSRELRVPVLMLAQMNRSVEVRKGKPQLSDLRESGSIEQDSDIVMFLHREETPESSDPEGTTELIIRKHRGGPVGTVKLAWFDRETRFADFQREYAA